MSSPEVQKTIPAMLGPLSLVGVCVGMVAWVTPALYGGASAWALVLPGSGVLMTFVPHASVRQFGAGLVASVLVWPFTLIGVLMFAGGFR